MSKVIKKIANLLLHTLSGVVLVAILLILGVALAFSLPRVQTFAAQEATKWLQEHSGVTITVGAISLEQITRLTAKELYVEDLDGDTLLWASHLSGIIDRNALLHRGEFIPSSVRVEDAKFYLLTDSLGKNNIDKLIQHFENIFPADTTKSGGKFSIKETSVDHLRFRLYDERLAGRTPPTAIDYSDMDIMVESADFGEIAVVGSDVILTQIDNITAIDKSGAELHDSSMGSLLVGEGLLDFRNIYFLTGKSSRLQLPYLIISAPSWDDYSEFNDRVKLNLQLKNCIAEPEAAGKWVAELGYYGLSGKSINGIFKGMVNDFVTNVDGFFYDAQVVAVGEVRNITRPSQTNAEVNVDLNSTPQEVRAIYRGVLGETLPEDIGVWVDKFDTLALHSRARIAPHKVQTITNLSTNLGGVTINGAIDFDSLGGSFEGEVRSNGVNVGKLLAVEELGKAYLTANGRITLVDGKVEGEVDTYVDRLRWKGYDFEDVELKTSLTDSLMRVVASSNDKNVVLVAEGEGNLRESEPEYNLLLNIEKIDFGAMGFTKEERTSWLSGNMEASLIGRTLDDMTGKAMINDLVYASAADTLSTELVNISLAGGNESKSFSLYSPIVDVEYRSTAPYKSVLDYLTKTLPSQLPLATDTTPLLTSEGEVLGTRIDLASDYTAMAVNIKEGERLAAVIYPTAAIAPDSYVTLEFSPTAQEFALALESEYLAVDDMVISELSIDATGAASNLNLLAECDELLLAGISIPDVNIQAGSRAGGEVDASLDFSHAASALSGRFSVNGTLTRDSEGDVVATASIYDSYLISPTHRWDIATKRIDYNTQAITIESFGAESADGGLYIGGQVSESTRNPLAISLKNIELGEWVSLLTDLKDMEGYIDGDVTLYSALKTPFGEGSLSLSNLSVGGVKIDPVMLNANIQRRSTTLDLTLHNTLLGSTLASATYDYRKGDYTAAITADNLDVSLLGPLFKDIASNVGGVGSIDLDLSGRKNGLNIDGFVALDNFTTKLNMTGVTYSTERLTLSFDDNRGQLTPLRLSDGEGGWADVEGSINLEKLSDVGLNLSFIPHNLVAIDLPAGGQDPFYGKVYASGGLRLLSQGGKTEVSGAISTGAGSIFNLPLVGNNDFAGADFVTFIDRSATTEESASAQMIARRKREHYKKTHPSVDGGMSLDVMLDVGTNTLLRIIIDPATDNVIEARGVADLGISYDGRMNDFAIRGDYEISEGVYNFNFQNIITKQFTINPDSYLRWNGNPLDANINVGATYKLKTSLAPLLGGASTASRASTPVECIVDLTGSLSKVNVSFDINVPNANTEYQSILSSYFSSQEMMATQFVYLLALGNFYSDSTSEQTNTPGAASSAIGLDFLASQVSKLVSNDAYKFNLKYKAIDDTSSSYSLDFETEIIDDRLLLELEANVDTGTYYQLGNEHGNQLSGGGAVTLLLDNTGDFYLRGFSRTIDRFDENQGLQENGVGLYFKRSFNRLSDLWRKKKSRAGDDSEKSDTFVTTDQAQPKQQEKK